MSSVDPRHAREEESRRRREMPERPALWKAGGQRVSEVALAGLMTFLLSGCADVPQSSEDRPAQTRPVPVQAAAATQNVSPFDEWIKSLGDRRSKLVVAGGAGLLLAMLVGLGVRKVLRGEAPGPPSPG